MKYVDELVGKLAKYKASNTEIRLKIKHLKQRLHNMSKTFRETNVQILDFKDGLVEVVKQFMVIKKGL
ncbi:hypothetical protein BKA70DRAFT_1432078 [Coprinopsis sp. MPI-PUGE-AT-0042]|nr:hypothetical protein BKA70DRAFT_1432078 [Coprinopsis sp. MPI-PUGE-AT-0042]